MIIPFQESVYVVLGVDENEFDQVLGVFRRFEDAKASCICCPDEEVYFDLWIEKHDLS